MRIPVHLSTLTLSRGFHLRLSLSFFSLNRRRGSRAVSCLAGRLPAADSEPSHPPAVAVLSRCPLPVTEAVRVIVEKKGSVFLKIQLQSAAMPRYYCDYCDTYLTHDSPSVRKQHNAGYKHKANVRTYYQQFEEQQTQSLIDQRIKEHLGQAAAFQQVGAAYNQHLLVQRPRLPVLPTPMMPQIPGTAPLLPGIRPPVLPRPVAGAPGFVPPTMPPMVAPPGAPSLPGQVNIPMRPPPINVPTTIPGSTTTPTSAKGAPSMAAPPAMYQANPVAQTSGGYDSFNVNAPAPESNQ